MTKRLDRHQFLGAIAVSVSASSLFTVIPALVVHVLRLERER